ncbi:MAG TPA: BatD family protein, partial [Chitinophagaceae bacterium]|nr:BatD family protein [Chitinophagaceae bacterium]
PQQPLVAGESFQVQYILEDADNASNLKPPIFKNFRYVAGPNLYTGSVPSVHGSKPLRNFVYTLEATRPGRFMIPGTTIVADGQLLQSDDVWVKVITKEEATLLFGREMAAMSSDYILRPGEDPYQKIRKNLFLKVLVDKRSCYAGEPVTATFKLYSRLESKSDIVKNPGFYGFTVFDMVNLADKQVAAEMLNGKVYDVHTIRKVQLYPLQAGVFTIDPMEVRNKVEFSRSVVNKKTEQQIAEGMLSGSEEEPANKHAEVFESSMSSEAVTITVRPSPEKNKPALFTGATGNFSISAALVRTELRKNEEAWLEVTVSGKGNFLQLIPPAVQWPAAVETFDAANTDKLDKTKVPLAGSRTFRFPFVAAEEGDFEIPAISYAFFDPDSNRYKTMTTKPVRFRVSGETVKEKVVTEKKKSVSSINTRASWVAGSIVAALFLAVFGYWLLSKKEPVVVKAEETLVVEPSADEQLKSATQLAQHNDPAFYNELHRVIWEKLGHYFGLEGTNLNKAALYSKLVEKEISPEMTNTINHILTECETNLYTTAALESNKEQLLADARKVLASLA